MRSKAFVTGILISVLSSMTMFAQEVLNYPLDTINGEEVYLYEADRGIGLYRIGINFNVTQSELVRFNPQLRERGLQFGEVLFIPTHRPIATDPKKVKEEGAKLKKERQSKALTKTEAPEVKQKAVVKEEPKVEEPKVEEPAPAVSEEPEVAQKPMETEVEETAEIDLFGGGVPDDRHVIELALMLPFESHQTKRSSTAERMTEFYQGALLALKDLQNDSTLYRLRVFDSERSERRVRELCDSSELENVKAILGLAYPIQIERMASWCDTNGVPLLLPFSDDIELEAHPQVLQFNSTDEQEADSLCAWIARQDSLVHCVTLEVKDADQSAFVRMLRKRLKANGIVTTGLALTDLMTDSVGNALDSVKENIILLNSDKYQQIRPLIPHLERLREAGYRVRLIGQYAWEKEAILFPQVYTSMFTSDLARDEYDIQWSRYFSPKHVSATPRYDLLGYDLMQALVTWLQGGQESYGLQSIIRWKQAGEGGWLNANVEVVVRD